MSEETRELRNGTLGGLLVFALTFGACAFVGCKSERVALSEVQGIEILEQLRDVQKTNATLAKAIKEPVQVEPCESITKRLDAIDAKLSKCARCHK